MNTKQTAIVIGTGAGGAVAAKELQGRYQVTILEAGKDFKPFSQSIPAWSRLRGTGMFFDESLIRALTMTDHKRMNEAVLLCRDILLRLGVPLDQQFLGTLNAGHPGGMLPLTSGEKDTLHSPRLPENLYVADATILPKAMGYPPILTIMALAKKIAGLV